MKELKKYLEQNSLDKHRRYFLEVYEHNHKSITYGDLDSDYYIASCSKSVFGAILFQELLKDKHLPTKFNSYLSSLGVESESVGIYDFLNHTTNLVDYLEHFEENHGSSNDEIIDQFVRNRKISKVLFNYSNTNYVLLYSFLKKQHSTEDLLNRLNKEISEEFSLVRDEIINSTNGTGSFIFNGPLNRVFGDGGIIFCPKKSKKNKKSFIKKLFDLVNENIDYFKNHSVSINEKTSYGFGLFYKEKKDSFWIYHSGSYQSNISYWGHNSNGQGFFFSTNFSDISPTEVTKIIGL